MVDFPLGGEPVINRFSRWSINLLYPSAVIHPSYVGMDYPCVLGKFTKEVLTVDQLEISPP